MEQAHAIQPPSSRDSLHDAHRSLVEAARWAPSPDNNQPWAFASSEPDVLKVLHVRRRAIASDARDLFSWLAVGAAIENVCLAASAQRQQAQVVYHAPPFANVAGEEHVASVHLADGGSPDPLFQQIQARCTNRRPYQPKPIETATLDRLSPAVTDPASEVHWIGDRRHIRRAAGLVQQCDRIRFEDQLFHEELHSVLRYSQAEAEACGDGMSLKSLEIPAAMGPILRLLRPWPRARAMNYVGLSRVFAGIAAQQVSRSGALGWLVTADASDRGYLEAGRSLQRIWLAATEANLAMQPLGSLPLFLTKLEADRASFQPHHAAKLERIRDAFGQLLPFGNRAPVMLFRLGVAAPPSARSVRYATDSIRR